MQSQPRILVCFDCKEYMLIRSGDFIQTNEEQAFKSKHSGHRTSITLLSEIRPKKPYDPVYKLFIRGQ